VRDQDLLLRIIKSVALPARYRRIAPGNIELSSSNPKSPAEIGHATRNAEVEDVRTARSLHSLVNDCAASRSESRQRGFPDTKVTRSYS